MTNVTTRNQLVRTRSVEEDPEIARVRKLEENARRNQILKSSRDDLLAL
jgi:hypothetical protein